MPVAAAVQFFDALCVDLGDGFVVKDEPRVRDPCVLRQWGGEGSGRVGAHHFFASRLTHAT